MTYGIISDNGVYVKLLSKCVQLPGATKTIAEVTATMYCIEAIEHLSEYSTSVYIYSDSQVTVDLFNGRAVTEMVQVNQMVNDARKKIYAYRLLGYNVYIRWISRQYNDEADKLSKMGIHVTLDWFQ